MCEEDEELDWEFTIGLGMSFFVCVIIFIFIGIYHTEIQSIAMNDFKLRNESKWDEVPYQFGLFLAFQAQNIINLVYNLPFAENSEEFSMAIFKKGYPFLIAMFASLLMMTELFARTIRDSKLYLLLFPFCFSFFLLEFYVCWK